MQLLLREVLPFGGEISIKLTCHEEVYVTNWTPNSYEILEPFCDIGMIYISQPVLQREGGEWGAGVDL